MPEIYQTTILVISLIAAVIGAGRAALVYICDVDLLGMEFKLEGFLYEVLTSAAIYFTVCITFALLAFVSGIFVFVL